MFAADFDMVRRRLSIRYAGFWTDADVRAALGQLGVQLERARSGGPFTLLEDFRDFPVQQSSVIDASQSFIDLIDQAPVSRDALIVTSALLRAQLRRQPDSKVACEIFASPEEAELWLREVEPAVHAERQG